MWINIEIIGDVVAIIFQRRWIKWQKPDRANTQFLEIIELLDQAPEIADTIRVAVVKSLHVQLINNGVLKPKRVRHDLKLFARGRARRNAELSRYRWTRLSFRMKVAALRAFFSESERQPIVYQ